MATAAVVVDSNPPAATAAADHVDLPLRLDSIPTVDLNLISQSELYLLSLCSSSTFDPRRCEDVVIPKIDRSVFNESAGSRKQTYSRLRLAPASFPNALRRHGPHLRTTNHNPPIPYHDSDPEVAESRQIVDLLKQLFGIEDNSNNSVSVSNGDFVETANQLVPVRVDYSDTMPQTVNVGNSMLKRKRGRPATNVVEIGANNSVGTVMMNEIVVHENVGSIGGEMMSVDGRQNEIVVYENADDKDREIVNIDGVVVDLIRLGELEDPYAEELQRRTEGMSREEELLGFMGGLTGEWVSRRKKRRIVDASEFGNVLPKGWRLMLACRKKDNRIWVFCRRYLRFYSNCSLFLCPMSVPVFLLVWNDYWSLCHSAIVCSNFWMNHW